MRSSNIANFSVTNPASAMHCSAVHCYAVLHPLHPVVLTLHPVVLVLLRSTGTNGTVSTIGTISGSITNTNGSSVTNTTSDSYNTNPSSVNTTYTSISVSITNTNPDSVSHTNSGISVTSTCCYAAVLPAPAATLQVQLHTQKGAPNLHPVGGPTPTWCRCLHLPCRCW